MAVARKGQLARLQHVADIPAHVLVRTLVLDTFAAPPPPSGQADMAVSSSVGSNIFDILAARQTGSFVSCTDRAN